MSAATPVVPRLTRWGVTPDADLVYRALAMVGASTSGALARELGMSQHRVARALDELAAVRAVRPLAGTSAAGRSVARSWQPAAVDEVVRMLRRPRGSAAGPAERWRWHLAALAGIDVPAGPSPTITHLPSRQAARERAGELLALERHEHLAINPEQVYDAQARQGALPLQAVLLQRRVRMLALGVPPLDADRSAAFADALYAAGTRYRERPTLPIKLMVFDRRVAFFPADPLDLERGYIEVAEPSVVHGLCGLFHRLWGDASDPRLTGVSPIKLSAREQALVDLLSLGHTDQSAADELRLSVRTVAYTMRALMDRLGVENRFQLALLLGATGSAPVPAPDTAGPDTATAETANPSKET